MSPAAAAANALLPPAWALPASIRQRVGKDAGPQRAMIEEGHLLLILHEPPGPAEVTRKPAFYWRKPGGDWSVRRHGGNTGSLGDFLKDYEELLLKLETRQTGAATAAAYHTVLEEAAPVLRASRGLHRTLQQARESIKEDSDLINCRDRAAAIERTAELLVQDAQFGLSYIAARQSEAQAAIADRMAATAHRLNILAALFLPLTAIASLLSMEVHSGLANTRENFWIIITRPRPLVWPSPS